MSDKKLHTLTIDPEFRDLIPPLNDDELTMLEESIVANGCESPLIVWNGVIVDGHNRHAICQKHNIPFAVTEKEFSSREDAMLWMLRNQLGRRNLNSYQRGELALKFEPLIASASKKRMLAGKAIDPPQNSAEGRLLFLQAFSFLRRLQSGVQTLVPVHHADSCSDCGDPAGCGASTAWRPHGC